MRRFSFLSITLALLLGLANGAWAEPGGETASKSKPAKRQVSIVRQENGGIVERLELPVPPGAADQDRIPATPEEWLARMIDPSRNGLVLKQPKYLAAWLDAVTEPRFMTALASVARDTATYPNTLNRLLDPATARHWVEFIDPEIFMRWVAAGMDPRLYQAVFQHMFDPSKHLRWATYTANAGGHEGNEAALARQSDARAVDAAPASAGVWWQLPARESGANPWLVNSRGYRY